MTFPRLLLPLSALLLLGPLFFPVVCPAQPVSESASGFTEAPRRTPVPTPTDSSVVVAPTATPRPVAEESRDPAAHPASGDSPALVVTDADLASPRPLGPPATPVPPEAVALVVRVEGFEAPSGQFCFPVEPLAKVALEPRIASEEAETSLAGPSSMNFGKPRTYRLDDSTRIAWALDSGALVSRTSAGTVWQAPVSGDACRVSVTLERQTRFEDLSETALHSPALARGMIGEWSATFLVKSRFDPAGDGILDGYTLGIYPNPSLDSAPASVRSRAEAYAPPRYFIPVTPETEGLRVSPRFRLGDFSPVSERGKRHFIALDDRLIQCLEALGDQLDREGFDGSAIRILRGYVSPYQRQLLSREGVPLVEFTRFQYGDSATVLVDSSGDGRMDDLSGDGVVDAQDADRLADLVEAAQRELGIYGGIGVYARFDGFGHPGTPTVQIDTRGWRQRWRQAEE